MTIYTTKNDTELAIRLQTHEAALKLAQNEGKLVACSVLQISIEKFKKELGNPKEVASNMIDSSKYTVAATLLLGQIASALEEKSFVDQ